MASLYTRGPPSAPNFLRREVQQSYLHGHSGLSRASCRHRRRTPRIVLEELSGASERPMIIPMTITARLQQRYDHRLRNLVRRTGDVTIATNLGVPRGTARGWLGRAPEVVVSLDVTHLSELELQHEILTLRRRMQKLAALLQLVLAVLRVSGFTLSHERLPDGRAKVRILRAVDRARACMPLRTLLRFLRLSPSRFHAWRRQDACALDDQASCPRTSPHRLTPAEVQVIKDMVTSPEYRHVPTGTLAVLAQRLGTVWASPSTWYRLVRTCGWRRPRLRLHPAAEDWGAHDARGRDVAHRHHRHPFARRDPRLSARGDRQLLATDSGWRVADDRPSAGGVLRRRTQSRAAAFGVSRTDA